MPVLPLVHLLAVLDMFLAVPRHVACAGCSILFWTPCKLLGVSSHLVPPYMLRNQKNNNQEQGVLSWRPPTALAHASPDAIHGTLLPGIRSCMWDEGFRGILNHGKCRSRDLASLSHSEVPSQHHCSCITSEAQACSLRPSNFAPARETILIGSPPNKQRRATTPVKRWLPLHALSDT